MTQLERVPASRLRPGDVLYACDRQCVVAEVHPMERVVRLRLNAAGTGHFETRRVFSVPKSCHFKRMIQSRRIEMGRKAKRGAK